MSENYLNTNKLTGVNNKGIGMRRLFIISIVTVLYLSTISAIALDIQSSPNSNNSSNYNLLTTQNNMNDIVGSVVSQVDEEFITSHIINIVSYGPHPTGSIACGQVAEYIYNQFESYGLEVSYHDWYHNESVYGKNVEAVLPGLSDESYIISAHYDSWYTSPAADDDGSGVAAVLAAAYVLSQFEFNHTIKFVTFSGEEQGLIGSNFYVKDAYENSENIKGNLNIDMIGYAETPIHEERIKVFTNSHSNWLLDISDEISDEYSSDIDMIAINLGYTWTSDHFSFWKYGYDSIFYHEYKFNDYMHTPEDTLDNMNPYYATKSARFIISTLASLANQPYIENIEPQMPEEPFGPTSAKLYKKITYGAICTDPDGDDLYYLFDWGDGSNSGWIGPYSSGQYVEASHIFLKEGTFNIRVKTKDIHGIQSQWSDIRATSIPRDSPRNAPLFLDKIQRFREIFDILKTLSENLVKFKIR